MKRSSRLLVFLVVLVALIALVAVLPSRTDVSNNGGSRPRTPRVNLIAYVDPEGQVKLARPDGSSQIKISPDGGFFTWPAWSPDGRRVAFSGVPSRGSSAASLTLYVYESGNEGPRIVFANERDMGPILPEMPHYPLWAPDGGHLSFMSSAPQGLTLFLADPQAVSGPEVVLRSAPLYASWSADSRRLVVHGGVDHFLVDVEGDVTVEDLGIQTSGYRVPAWWPLGDRIVYVSEDEAGQRGLYMAGVESGGRTLLEEVEQEAAFLWSPGGRSLAVGQAQLTGGLVYQGITLFAPDGSRRRVNVPEEVAAFFWSPDGTRLAYVTLSERLGVFRWMVMKVADGERWPLVEFIPSEAQLTLLRFFDQFAYSHSPWSPDGDSLVFAGNLFGGAVSASLKGQGGSQIIVTGAGPQPVAEAIAEGFLAVWSPR